LGKSHSRDFPGLLEHFGSRSGLHNISEIILKLILP